MIFSTRLQEILKRFKTGEITISVRDDNSPNTGKETKRQYEARLLQSIKELDEGKGIQFTQESFEDYVKNLGKA